MNGASLKRNAFVLVGAIAALAIIGDWSGDATLATLWRFFAVVLLAGLAYESWVTARSGLKIEVLPPEQFFLGRSAVVQFVLTHSSRRPWRVEVSPPAPDFFEIDVVLAILDLPSSGTLSFERRVTATHLGEHSWPAVQTRTAGPFGLAWWPKRLQAECTVRVRPDLFRSAAEVKGVTDSGAKIGLNIGGGTEIMRLRDYRAGDPPRVVDWKATARSNRLISRDFAVHDGLQVVIAIDAGRSSGLRAGNLDRFGHYVNVAARLAQFAAERDDLVGIVLYADRPLAALAPARGVAAVARIRQMLAASRIENRESNPLFAAMRVRSLVRHRSLVVFLTDVDDVSAGSQLAQAARFLLPKHLPFVAGLSSEAAQVMALAPASEWLDPYRSLAAQEYCVGLERKVRALNALGAPALVARPQHLERAVFAAYTDFRRQRRA
jgi:uncharacterized protein (DUF58 family)